jgi:hypothetical protein
VTRGARANLATFALAPMVRALHTAAANEEAPMRTLTTMTMLLPLALFGCDKKKPDGDSAKKPVEAAHATCDDVDKAMRRIEPERTADIKPGAFAQVCKDDPVEFDGPRRDCIVAAQTSFDLKVCDDPSLAPIEPPAGATDALAWRDVPKFGVKVQVPGNVTVDQQDTNAHLTNGAFKLNLFHVDEYSQKSAAEVKAGLSKEKGFVKFTKEEVGKTTWHFDYELAGGKAGTTSRIDAGAGKVLDCGVFNVDPAVATVASAACTGAKPL